LLAEKGFWEYIFVACRTDANRDLRAGIEWEEAVILTWNDNDTSTTHDVAKSSKGVSRSLSGFVFDISGL
jgi:hypothetical protein